MHLITRTGFRCSLKVSTGWTNRGTPDGMNMEKIGQSWSVLKQNYSDEKRNNARLTIVTGTNTPGLREFKTMQNFNMQSGTREVKTLEVSGYKVVLDLNKQGGKAT